MKQILTLLLVIFLSNAQEKTIKKDFDKASQIRLELKSGDVDFTKSKDAKIHISVKHSYDEDDFNPVIEQRGNRIIIKERDDRGWGRGNNSRGDSYWSVSIPNGMEIEISSGSSTVNINDIEFKEFEGNTGSGDFKFDQTKGDVQLNAGSGDMSFSSHIGEIELNTGSGDIDVKKSEGQVKVNTGSGDIEARNSKGSFRLNTGSGNIDLLESDLTDRTTINSGSGDLTIELSSALKEDLELNTGSGDITLDYQGNKISGYFEFKARYENRIKTPFKYKKEEKVERYGNDYYLKTAEVGSNSPSIYLSTGSGVLKVIK